MAQVQESNNLQAAQAWKAQNQAVQAYMTAIAEKNDKQAQLLRAKFISDSIREKEQAKLADARDDEIKRNAHATRAMILERAGRNPESAERLPSSLSAASGSTFPIRQLAANERGAVMYGTGELRGMGPERTNGETLAAWKEQSGTMKAMETAMKAKDTIAIEYQRGLLLNQQREERHQAALAAKRGDSTKAGAHTARGDHIGMMAEGTAEGQKRYAAAFKADNAKISGMRELGLNRPNDFGDKSEGVSQGQGQGSGSSGGGPGAPKPKQVAP